MQERQRIVSIIFDEISLEIQLGIWRLGFVTNSRQFARPPVRNNASAVINILRTRVSFVVGQGKEKKKKERKEWRGEKT